MSRFSTRRNPASLRTGIPNGAEVETCFSSGITNLQADNGRASMAKLSQSEILKLVHDSGFPNAQVLLRRPLIMLTCVEVQYQIDLDAQKPNETTLELRIAHLANVDAAQAAMKKHLATSERNLSEGVTASPGRFGNCSLENRSTILWWYLRHFIRVSIRTGTGPDLVAARAFSKLLNDHLIESEVDENALISPQPAIQGPTSVTLDQRSHAQLRIANMWDTYHVQRLTLSNPIVLLVTQGPTRDGMVEIYGRQPGTTQLVIRMAHIEYLTVNTVEFTITINAVAAPPRTA